MWYWVAKYLAIVNIYVLVKNHVDTFDILNDFVKIIMEYNLKII